MNILVFPCGSEIGLEIHKSLRYAKGINLFGASSVSDHGEYVYDRYFGDLPSIEDSNFIIALNKIIDKYSIDFIFPAHDSVSVSLSKNREILKCSFIGSDLETTLICRSKLKTYKLMKEIIPTPIIYNSEDNMNFPVFLKPDVGQGSKGCFIAYTKDDVFYHINKDPSLLILENLPGNEFTIDCFTDRHKKLRYARPRKRARILNGISSRSFQVSDFEDKFKSLADKINNTLNFQGVWFFQVKEREDGELVLMEISSRVAGTMGVSRNKGINLALLSILDKSASDLSIIENNYDLELDRCFHNKFKIDITYKKVYLDFDDTLLIKGKLNILVISFIYQCLNKSIEVYLITKHSKNIINTLKREKVDPALFNAIIHLNQNEEKFSFIDKDKSIFIDDSFSERSQVLEKLGIPVFDVDMVESLLDYSS